MLVTIIVYSMTPELMTFMSWFVLVNQNHIAWPVYSETQMNDSNEVIHFGESKTYCTTGVVWFLNKWLLWVDSFQWIKSYFWPVNSKTQSNNSYEANHFSKSAWPMWSNPKWITLMSRFFLENNRKKKKTIYTDSNANDS